MSNISTRYGSPPSLTQNTSIKLSSNETISVNLDNLSKHTEKWTL